MTPQLFNIKINGGKYTMTYPFFVCDDAEMAQLAEEADSTSDFYIYNGKDLGHTQASINQLIAAADRKFGIAWNTIGYNYTFYKPWSDAVTTDIPKSFFPLTTDPIYPIPGNSSEVLAIPDGVTSVEINGIDVSNNMLPSSNTYKSFNLEVIGAGYGVYGNGGPFPYFRTGLSTVEARHTLYRFDFAFMFVSDKCYSNGKINGVTGHLDDTRHFYIIDESPYQYENNKAIGFLVRSYLYYFYNDFYLTFGFGEDRPMNYILPELYEGKIVGRGPSVGPSKPGPDPDPGQSTPQNPPSTGSGTGGIEDDGKFQGHHSSVLSTGTGLYRAYAMSQYELTQLARKLWDGNILDELVKKQIKMDELIMGVLEFPFILPAGNRSQISFSWLPNWAEGTAVYGRQIGDKYQVLDFGYVDVKGYYGAFYDYEPYSTAMAYLPYVGFVPLKMTDLMNQTVHLMYTVDVTTGSAVAELYALSDGGQGLLGTYSCSMGLSLPISQRNFSSAYAIIGKTAAVFAAAAAATIVPELAPAVMQATGVAAFTPVAQELPALSSGALTTTGSQGMTTMGTFGAGPILFPSNGNAGGANYGGALNTGWKPNSNDVRRALDDLKSIDVPISRNGSMDANAGRLSPQEACLFLRFPTNNKPANYNNLLGVPSNLSGTVGGFSGYNEFSVVRLHSQIATAPELEEAENLLQGGVVI